VLLQLRLQFLHLAGQLVLGGPCGFGSVDGLLQLVGMIQDQSIECVFMLLLQLLGPLHDKLLNFFVLAAVLGGKRLLKSGEVFFLGVK
jgi:hypothetical protein